MLEIYEGREVLMQMTKYVTNKCISTNILIAVKLDECIKHNI
jgi:hypothetical protein